MARLILLRRLQLSDCKPSGKTESSFAQGGSRPLGADKTTK